MGETSLSGSETGQHNAACLPPLPLGKISTGKALAHTHTHTPHLILSVCLCVCVTPSCDNVGPEDLSNILYSSSRSVSFGGGRKGPSYGTEDVCCSRSRFSSLPLEADLDHAFVMITITALIWFALAQVRGFCCINTAVINVNHMG